MTGTGRPPATSHDDTVIDQFTRQAEGFSTAAMNEPAALEPLMRGVEPSAADDAVDVACGPGITTAALARRVRRVTGVDVTPAMIDLAERRCAGEGLVNTTSEVADVAALPLPEDSATVVVCRYALPPRAVSLAKENPTGRSSVQADGRWPCRFCRIRSERELTIMPALPMPTVACSWQRSDQTTNVRVRQQGGTDE